MGWYKLFSGLPQDAKLAVIARKVGLRRGEVLAIWLTLLDHASVASPRGSISDIEAEEIAAALEFDPAIVETTLKALRGRKMILPEGMLTGWSRHQKISTPRTRAYRARTAAAASVLETDTARRQRLQNEMTARHKKRGHILAE